MLFRVSFAVQKLLSLVGLIPLVGGALSLDGIRGGCVPEGSLGSLFTEGRGCEPTWIVVWPGTSQH